MSQRVWFIEASCFTVVEQSLYAGPEAGLRAHLDEMSRRGWLIAAAYELPARADAPRAARAEHNTT